jgi:hypothetical protein
MSFISFNTGTLVFLVICGLFYLRLAMIRGKKKKQAAALKAQRRKSGKKAAADDQPSNNQITYEVTSWWIIVPALILMIFGLTITTTDLLPVALKPYDWMFIAAGGILFIFGFK